MKEVLVLKELKQIKSVSHAYRIGILETFKEKPATAKQVSDILGEPHGKVNYHMKALAKAGILELVEEIVKCGVVEKYYLPVAKSFVIDSGVMKGAETKVIQTINEASNSLFDVITKEFYASLESPNKKFTNKLLHKTDVYLTEEEAQDLHAKLEEVIIDFLKDKDSKVCNSSKYFASTLLIPCEN